jgi:large exoprotein involved in heme utilization and adhesion
MTSLSDITASSDFGLSGVVEISRLDVDPSQGLTSLPTNLGDPTAMIDYQCQVGRSSTENKFTMTGRGGLPPNPNEPLGEENWLEDLGTPTPSGETGNIKIAGEAEEQASPTTSKAIVEAQGWMIGADGTVTLTAQALTNTPASITPQHPWQLPASCQNIPHSTASLTGTAY